MNTLKVGENAPHFSLLNQNGELVSLEQFKGKKVLVYFYPKALTPGCSTQACGLRDSKSELENLGVVILGISPDSPKKLAQFIEKKALNLKSIKWLSNLACGEKRNLWGVLLMVFTVSVFLLMNRVKLNRFLINLKPQIIIRWCWII